MMLAVTLARAGNSSGRPEFYESEPAKLTDLPPRFARPVPCAAFLPEKRRTRRPEIARITIDQSIKS